MTQEEIYDSKISPLMTQIIAICKEHKMPMIACFACPNDNEEEDGATLRCSTALYGPDFIGDQRGFKEADRILMRKPEVCAFTIRTESAAE